MKEFWNVLDNALVKFQVFILMSSYNDCLRNMFCNVNIWLQHWMEHGNLKDLIALDVDSSDNLTEDMLFKFIQSYGGQLQGQLLRLGYLEQVWKRKFTPT